MQRLANVKVINMSFSGSGFLTIYHLGAAQCLVNHGNLCLEKVNKMAGASGGSLIAACLLLSREKIDDALDFNLKTAEEALRKPLALVTPSFRILDRLQDYLENSVPHNGHVTASGKLFISLTNMKNFKNKIVSKFESRDELIQCLLGSSYLPVWGGMKAPIVQGVKYIDGGLTDNLPIFSDDVTVTVTPFSGNQDICPRDSGREIYITQANQAFLANKLNMTRFIHALRPPPMKILRKYYDDGFKDAENFLKREKMYRDQPHIII